MRKGYHPTVIRGPCPLCGEQPTTWWIIPFEVEHYGDGFRVLGGIRHVCEGCARSNRHLRPVSCECQQNKGSTTT